jgi:hypothetical protein
VEEGTGRAGRGDQPGDHGLPHAPGTSKWNRIEHRLFSRISMNWADQPLTSHETAVNLIAGTKTRTGLAVDAERDTGSYPRGIRIPDHHPSQHPDHLTVLFISRL